ncbi:unnamed protein product, partial [Ixodes hexagonus]
IEDYVPNVVPRYSDQQFKGNFRMHRNTFELNHVVYCKQRVVSGRTSRIPVATKILMTLWLLGSQESFRGVADRFGVNKGVLSYVAKQIIATWADAAANFIQWPAQPWDVSFESARKWGFPDVVGAVIGCHISVKAPEEEQDAYYNGKESHSIILQGCCGSRMMFTHVHAGSPGRMHDARVFDISGLNKIVDSLPPSLHVLGDSAYSLRVGLMRPYKNTGHLSEQRMKFNTTLGAARSVIERAFAQLKGKFRRIKYLDMKATETMNKYVVASCVLHNIILQVRDSFVIEGGEELEEDDDDPSFDGGHAQAADSRASDKQNAIARFLCTR